MDSVSSQSAVAVQKTNKTIHPNRTIGLLDHLGFGNLGDDATLDSVLQNLRNRWPHAKVIAFTMNPVDTYKRHHVPSYAIRLKWKSAPHNQKAVSSDKGFKARVKRETAKYRKLFALLRAINRVTIETPKLLLQESSFLVESFFLVKDLDLLVISGGGQLLDSWGGPWAFPYTIFKWVILAKLAHVKCYFVNVGAGPLEHSLSKWFVRSEERRVGKEC